MKSYTPEELQAVLAEHKKWLLGIGGSRADLSDADLSDFKIQKATVFAGLYTYLAMPIIAEDGTEWVRLGCYTRKVSEWEADFWNNPREFPNNGSAKSRERELAYKTCLAWLEIHRETSAASTPAEGAEGLKCIWMRPENGPHETGCGHTLSAWDEDPPDECGVKFCFFCGKLIDYQETPTTAQPNEQEGK